jgi:biopolymer transport protein TolR
MSKFTKKNGRRKPMAEINVVPYIDVTLVLLIIFMVTTPMLQTGVEVELPQAPEAKTETPTENGGNNLPLIISIKESGQHYIKFGDKDDELVLPEDINTQVISEVKNNPKLQVMIRADKRVDYGTVVTVMAALKNAGVPAVGLVTVPEDK